MTGLPARARTVRPGPYAGRAATAPAVRADAPPHLPRPPWPPPGAGVPARGRDDVCRRCDAFRTSCYCSADVDALRLFARRMAEIHEWTGTTSCGCGAHACYVRRRLDAIDRTTAAGP